MPTLRERPRGDSSPAKSAKPSQASPPSARKAAGSRPQRSSAMAADAIEVRESIEAKGDVEMDDVDAKTKTRRADAQNDANGDADVDADGDVDMDAEGETDDGGEQAQDQSSIDLLQLIKETSEYLCQFTIEVDGEEHEIAGAFQRLVNKRVLPDYFDVIKAPMAFSTIRGKLNKKTYQTFNEFVRDVTRICHNAQVYNRPSSLIFSDASRLMEVFKDKLADLVKKGTITAHDAVVPDLGPLPEFEDSPPAEDEDEAEEEEEDEEEEEEEEEEEDESEGEGGRRRSRKSGARPSRRDRGGDEEDPHRKRGRPPKVYTPLEARITAILKGLRRHKNSDGQVAAANFEKLPDKAELPDYYAKIQEPLSLELIKRKLKRKKYTTVDQALRDLNVMFENAKRYNEEGSTVFEDAVQLQKDAQALAEEQKKRPDEDFRDADGKLPLENVEHKGETWNVGDWVHIRNANDLSKPIVAQIYRLWSDKSGQKWVNACWFYRPEQTVHRFDKHFWEGEVLKTGRYKDHPVEDIEDRCFVMFITRFFRGRPRGLPADKAVYVCESRYNEQYHRCNKIKTWSSCLPDEVRDRDYEMTLFDAPRHMKKVPSPIKHLLQPDAKETDDPPKPTWGGPNAPPLIGAVHRRPREANESPPPEPHRPLPAQMPVALAMGPSPRPLAGAPYHPAAVAPAPGPASHYTQQFQIAPRQGPPPGQHGQVHIQPQPMAVHGQHHGGAQMQHLQPLQPMQQLQPMPPMPATQPFQVHPYQPTQQPHFTPQAQPSQQFHYQSPAHLAPAHESHFRPVHPAPTMAPRPQPVAPAPPSAQMSHHNGNQPIYNPPRAPEVYALTEAHNNTIPEEIREQFSTDDQGRVLFFTSPPIYRPNNGVAEQYAGLGHSAKHMSTIEQLREERRAKRKARDDAQALEEQANEKRRKMEKDKQVKQELKMYEEMGKKWLTNFVDEMTAGTEYILATGPGTQKQYKEWEEQQKALKEKEEADKAKTTKDKTTEAEMTTETATTEADKTAEAAAVPGADKV